MPTSQRPTPLTRPQSPGDLQQQARLRTDIRHALRSLRVGTASEVRTFLAPAWEQHLPGVAGVEVALREDTAVHCLPDERWLYVPRVVEGRCFTVAAPGQLVVLRVGVDLGTALRAFAGWDTVPLVHAGRRGLAQVVEGDRGRLLITPPGLLGRPGRGGPGRGGPGRGGPGRGGQGRGGQGRGAVGCLVPSAEGLKWCWGDPDSLASNLLSSALAAAESVLSRQSRVREWTTLDLDLLVLANDSGLRQGPVFPVSTMLGVRDMGRPAAAGRQALGQSA